MQQALAESNPCGNVDADGRLESPSVPEQLIRLSVGCEHVEDIWPGYRAGTGLSVEIF
jgi:cystathionine beta-lyase/cystathionine gamma-synthase